MSLDETKLFSIVTVADGISEGVYYDFERLVNPAGTLVVATASVSEANPGLPDYFVDIFFLGGAHVDQDPDKSIIRKLHSDVLASVKSWTPDAVTDALGLAAPARCCAILNITSTMANDRTKNAFRLDVRLVLTDIDFADLPAVPAEPASNTENTDNQNNNTI